MAASVSNYFIGKGVLSFTPTGGEKRDLGNVPEFEITPELEELPHNSSRAGVRSEDRSIVIEKRATVRVVLEEWTPENLGLALLADPVVAQGITTLDIFSNNAIDGALEFIGSNEIGSRYKVELPKVSFIPSGSLGFITDEWGQIELNGKVLLDAGSFGTVTLIGLEGEDDIVATP